ncbi:YdbL family protein [Atlantibacter sp.]|uniref:YdbL family protein n=1 Tax=Atlantibacter sp. TaxID=1903473 RepID=UPI0028A1E61E|nr:YdbL family protein [Atlantibacter sp.]
MGKKMVMLAGLLLLCQPAFALTLNEARQQGLVGETLDGYIAPRAQDSQTLALVKQINEARAQSYRELAERNHLPVDDVAKLAGQKLVERAAPGEYVRGINGQWLRRK